MHGTKSLKWTLQSSIHSSPLCLCYILLFISDIFFSCSYFLPTTRTMANHLNDPITPSFEQDLSKKEEVDEEMVSLQAESIAN